MCLWIFIQRGRADALQFAARQGRLEHVAGIHRALRRARTDHGVQLVDHQDDLALRALDFLDDGLEALLELTAEARTGDHRAQVQGDDALAREDLRHIIGGDLLRQAFDDGGLAHAGLADQHRVVLGAAGEDLDQAQDLVVAADDRVELAFAGQLGQVAGVFFEGAVARLGLRIGDALSAAQISEWHR